MIHFKHTSLKAIVVILTITGIVIFYGCDNPITGDGPQPDFIEESTFIPKLNVFGVLRPDMKDGEPRSFIHLERSGSPGNYSDVYDVTDAEVMVYAYSGNTIADSLEFMYTDLDSAVFSSEYRNRAFFPQTGEKFDISCYKEGFPRLTATTIIPDIPKIVNDRIDVSPAGISFYIERDTSAVLYDVELQIGKIIFTTQVKKPETGNIFVEFEISNIWAAQGFLTIYAYDLNLSEYMTYNLTIKPNTYQPPFSTVEGGYGCFGSLNILTRIVQF
ncbi:hypothetical protein ACFL6L_00630 [candidate division KSB1 bacterium]